MRAILQATATHLKGGFLTAEVPPLLLEELVHRSRKSKVTISRPGQSRARLYHLRYADHAEAQKTIDAAKQLLQTHAHWRFSSPSVDLEGVFQVLTPEKLKPPPPGDCALLLAGACGAPP